jgi:5-methylcytosine-specific restriction endonuclease McrA
MTPYNNSHHRQLRLHVLAAAGYRCHWCGAAATELDHVVAIAEGGPTTERNVVASCGPCNHRRGGALGGRLKAAKRLHTSRKW